MIFMVFDAFYVVIEPLLVALRRDRWFQSPATRVHYTHI